MKKALNENISGLIVNIGKPQLSRKYKGAAAEFLFRSRIALTVCISVIIAGCIIGGIIYSYLSRDTKNQIFSYMQNYFIGSVVIGAPQAEILKDIFTEHLITGLIILICCIVPYLYPLCFVRLFAKGLSLGFSTVFLVSRYGLKGLVFALASTILCNLPMLLSTVWFILAAGEARTKRRHSALKNKSGRLKALLPGGKQLLRLSALFGIYLILSCVSAVFQGIISYGLLKGLYTIFSANA
ncbi:MAG TPA: hypothetical protein H9900_05975 [Candidatus Monoglobus merdigallinarum]|uniref:Stage II sporulation protein M n=1 Tax=Candidatus Monoglobus merdigallinarum TaxID=2838698 RepID=A0A9D1PSD4_9FIRM|nr:hypothetical protein [Candidatus Monoglobus merdigallinarum]